MGCPSSDVDLWGDDVLADPYPTLAELRAAGPVVWLERHGLCALPRYAEVAAALADWRRFSSARGVGVDDEMNAAMGPNPLASDPPLHDTFRKPLVQQLSSAALAATAPRLDELAVRLAEAAVRAGTFDAVADLARPYSLTVVGDLVGLPPDDRDRYPELSERAFNVFGPAGPRTADGFLAAAEIIQRALAAAEPGGLSPAVGVRSCVGSVCRCCSSPTHGRASTPRSPRWPARCCCSPATPTSGTSCGPTGR